MTRTEPPHVLVVEDEPEMRQVLADMLVRPGWRVTQAGDGVEALELLAAQRPDVVLTDLNMPRMDGMELLLQINERYPGLPVVVLTAFGTVPGAVEAMRGGAFDFLSKPPPGPRQLREVIGRALACSDGSPKNKGEHGGLDLVHEDPAMAETLSVARAVAPRPTTVLITGESGVGKEVVARFIHLHSGRPEDTFVALNCAALPESLLESELFGHDRGAFTGAVKAHAGRFEQAHGGTLLLDEVGEMTPALQAKFLRVLETRRVTRLGSAKPRSVDVRVLAATNRDLEHEVAAGQFREDLLFRLSVFPIQIPPLRRRPGDVLPLARHFLALLGGEDRPRAFTPEAEALLRSHGWPGNVRELQNVVERAVILAGTGDIRPAHLRLGPSVEGASPPAPTEQPSTPDPAAPVTPRATNLKELEERAIMEALEATDGNRSQAARQLGIARRTLQYKLKKLGIE